jgi:transketolase
MRLAFVRALINSAKKTDNLHLLTGDLGFEVFEEYKDKFPQKFTNAGVGEANLVGVASGMAHLGYKVICYSLVPFLTFRAFEQIRNDVCYHNLDVKIVGVGGGLSYSLNGVSHTNIEDISVMRSLPNMTVICPGDPLEVYRATTEMIKMAGPTYLRLGKKGEPNLMYETVGNFQIGKAVEVKKGKEVAIFSTGNMLETTMNVVERLEKEGVDATHIHVHTIKPLDKEQIGKIIREHAKVVTIEEHSVIGGLGSAIAELNSTYDGCQKKQLMVGIEDKYFNIGGSQIFLRKLAGLDPETIVKRISGWFKG